MKNSKKTKAPIRTEYDAEFFRNRAQRESRSASRDFNKFSHADERYWGEHYSDDDIDEEFDQL